MKFACLTAVLLLASTILGDETSHFKNKIRPLLDKFCFDCHDPDDEDSESPFLEDKTLADINSSRHVWKSVAYQIRNRTMPPKRKKTQPSEEQRLLLADWIEGYLKKSALEMPDYAGAVQTRRLNRDEYDNSLEELTGIDFGFSESLPVDGSGGEGFDNNGETLFLPPLLMERYLESAQIVLDRSIILPKVNIGLNGGDFTPNQEETPDHLIKPGKAVHANITIPQKNDYQLMITTAAGRPESRLIVKLNGIPALKLKTDKTATSAILSIPRGIHRLSLLMPKQLKESIVLKSVTIKSKDKKPSAETLTAHKKIFKYPAGESVEESRSAASRNIAAFARKAWRRPVSGEEVTGLMNLYRRAEKRGDTFEESVKLALKAVLVSPHFLFMIEKLPTEPGIHRLSDHEMAVRLSYFLWSSMPDTELFELAEAGELSKRRVLEAQVARMLKDPRAEEFYKNFTGQWLGTKDVGGKIAPLGNQRDNGYSSELGFALRDEANVFIGHVLKNNLSLMDMLDADYVLINEVISKHYKIKGVEGKHYRQVKIEDGRRGGVLGLGGVHMVTSYPQRTSPVLRGAWVLETLLGTHVPSPPDNVPPLDTKSKKSRNLSIKEKLAMHRDKKGCATCHDLIDPIGFALENYDTLGRWRDKEKNGKKIDSGGVMPSGEKFDGPKDLRKILLSRKDEFARHFITKLLGYALGRSLVFQDEGTIERILTGLKKSNYSSVKLISLITASTPFGNRQMVEHKKSSKEKHH